MPGIQYPTNPNTDTAFVVQDDGKKNRALMIAPQDISTLELSDNPNSTKGYVTIDGKKHRVNLVADITGGGGSSLPDQTGHSGEFLTTDGTDASWGAVSQVPSTTGATQGDVLTVDSGGNAVWQAGGGGLPSQTGQSGKFLTTDGTDASWSDKPLVNKATGTYSIQLTTYSGDSPVSDGDTVCIGTSATVTRQGGVAIGRSASCGGSVTVGYNARTVYGGIAIGGSANATAQRAIQIGRGTNSEAGTVYFGLEDSSFAFHQYKLMDNDGTIPTARLTKVNTTVTLAAASWSGNAQTVSVTGMTATGVVFVNPDPSDQADYTSAGILCTAQAAGTLTFTCDTTPSTDIDVVVVML